MEPNRPALTPAQLVAVLIAGIPAVAKLLSAFGVYTLSGAQQDALTGALTWLGVLAGVLVAADAGLRSARNAAHAKVAATTPPTPVRPQPSQIYSTGAASSTWTTPRAGVELTNMTGPAPDDEPGDVDALPDYATTTVVPPDEGDRAPEATP